MEETTRHCAQCGRGFNPRRPTARFCSRSCGSQARWQGCRPEAKVCSFCKSSYAPPGRAFDTCSDECKANLQQARVQRPVCEDCGQGIGDLPARSRICTHCRVERRRARHRKEYRARQNYAGKAYRTTHKRTCTACGEGFESWSPTAKTCSKTCFAWASRHPGESRKLARTCGVCGIPFAANIMRRIYCSRRCLRLISADRRRARLAGVGFVPIDRLKIFERDRWTCQLCFKRIPKRLKSPHPRSATLDHIVPLAEGGEHTVTNVHAAHRLCNSSKSHRGGGEQLLLIG